MQTAGRGSRLVAVAVVTLAAAAGCDNGKERVARPQYDPQTVDPWLVEVSSDLAVQNAVIRQHTLYPYHFVEYGAVLNELGERNLAILIEHYRRHPGPVNVRRGDASDSLYADRVATVRQALQDAGVDVEQVAVADRLPGGDGLPGEQVIRVSRAPQGAGAVPPLAPLGLSIEGLQQ